MPPKKTTTTGNKKPVAAKTGTATKTGGATTKTGGAATKTGGAATKTGGATKSTAPAASSAPPKEEKKEETLPVLSMTMEEMLPLLLVDKDNVIKSKSRWPLVIDTSGFLPRLLMHRDVNLLNALNSEHMQPDRVRLALMGALRFGKPFVLDLVQNAGPFNYFCETCDKVLPGLSQMLLDKSILNEDNFKQLYKEGDHDKQPGCEYDVYHRYQVENFRFTVIITTEKDITSDLTSKLFTIRQAEQ